MFKELEKLKAEFVWVTKDGEEVHSYTFGSITPLEEKKVKEIMLMSNDEIEQDEKALKWIYEFCENRIGKERMKLYIPDLKTTENRILYFIFFKISTILLEDSLKSAENQNKMKANLMKKYNIK